MLQSQLPLGDTWKWFFQFGGIPGGRLPLATLTQIKEFLYTQSRHSPIPTSSKIHQDGRLKFQEWNAAFEPMIAAALQSESKTSLSGPLLALWALTSDLVVELRQAPESREREQFVKFVSQRVVDLGRQIAQHKAFRKTFSCDDGIIRVLCTVAREGRHMDVRREAAEVLRSIIPRRENMWDSEQVVRSCDNLLDMEERRESECRNELGLCWPTLHADFRGSKGPTRTESRDRSKLINPQVEKAFL
jgi:hypothetical protein